MVDRVIKFSSQYLFVIVLILLFSTPLNTYGQCQDTGNWKIGFYPDENGGLDKPYYQIFLHGKLHGGNTKVKLLVRVDIAVINGFCLVVTDENNNILHLGDNAIVRITEDWENDEILKTNFQNYEFGSLCTITEQTSLNRFADLLCNGKFAIIIQSSGRFSGDRLYVFEIYNETLRLGEAVDNLIYFYKSINDVLKINNIYIGD